VLKIGDLVAFEGGLAKILGKRLLLVPLGGRSNVHVKDLIKDASNSNIRKITP
jgi:hypothetical protein